MSPTTFTNPSSLVSTTDSWDASAIALLKTAAEGPTTALNKELLYRVNQVLPFASATAILDTGCGVAQVLGRLLETYGADLPTSTRLVAADLSHGMIDVVCGRIKEAQATTATGGTTREEASNPLGPWWAYVRAVVWDAQDLAVQDETFSHVTAGLLLLMVERPRAVLAETRRVLRSGGVFGLTSFRRVEWMDLIEQALAVVRPGTRLGAIPPAWASTDAIRRELEEACFSGVQVDEVRVFYEYTDAEEMLRFNMANIPSVKAVTATMTGEQVERAVQWMIQWLGDRFPDGKGRLEGLAIIATATKP